MAITDADQLRATLVANLTAGMLCQTTLLNMFDTLAVGVSSLETPHVVRLGNRGELVFPSIWNFGSGDVLYTALDDGSIDSFLNHLLSYLRTLHVNLSRIRVVAQRGEVWVFGGTNHSLPDEILPVSPNANLAWDVVLETLTMSQANGLGGAITTADTAVEAQLCVRVGSGSTEGVDYFLFETGLQPLGTDLSTLDGTWDEIRGFVTGSLGGSISIDVTGLSLSLSTDQQIDFLYSVVDEAGGVSAVASA